ncbi:MAG: Asp-tRNA(Asn)/Glu-tRNA(Gln) amidotransferase subunit GatB [Patescibacteria group bacterium]
MKKYTPIIGLEIHAELKTKSKMFCGCKNDPFNAPQPNIYVCPICMGMPGGLPVANKQAIEWTVQLGMALGCKINHFSKFDRKHYFYPDLPKGYQISQYDLPFCYDGFVETADGPVKIRRIHLEEDTAKMQHKVVDGKKVSLIDFNRSSLPLVELVSEPDIKNGQQAAEYGKKIRQMLRFLNIADCDMEQGGMRLEANISLQRPDETELPGYKVEVKNINSFRFLQQAIDFEITRQAKILDTGDIPVQETRGWDSIKNETFSQRIKEEAADYRYFPDPDLPPIRFSEEQLANLKSSLPELPEILIKKWQERFGIEERFAKELIKNHRLLEKYNLLLVQSIEAGISANELVKAIINKKINFDEQSSISEVVQSFKQSKETDSIDESEIVSAIEVVLSTNQDAVEKYKSGKTQVIGFLIGQIMRQIGKKIDPAIVKKILESKL